MHPRHAKDNKHVLRGNVALVPRCLAVVLKEIPRHRSTSAEVLDVEAAGGGQKTSKTGHQLHHHESSQQVHDELTVNDGNKTALSSSVHHHHHHNHRSSGHKQHVHHRIDSKIPKLVFDAFVQENKNCAYLGESIRKMKYKGCIEHVVDAFVLLLGSDEVDLEIIRNSWTKRMLKPPKGFFIHGIGDVNGIEMQTIPQTQFISLPEAVSDVVSDLNANKIPATKDVLKQRLLENFRGMHLPSDKMVEESLQILVAERKVYQTGETFHVTQTDSVIPAGTSASDPCPIHSQPTAPHSNNDAAAIIKQNQLRSLSFRLPKQKENKDPSPGGLAAAAAMRPGSIRINNNRQPIHIRPPVKNTNIKSNNLKDNGKTEKLSFLDKLFGRYKKREPPEKDVEYATFSGQFPPPEWQWYAQTRQGACNYIVPKSQSWHNSVNGAPQPQQIPESQTLFSDMHMYACIGTRDGSVSSGGAAACTNMNRRFCMTPDPAEMSKLVSASPPNTVSNISGSHGNIIGATKQPTVVKRRSLRRRKSQNRNSMPVAPSAAERWNDTMNHHFTKNNNNNAVHCRRSMGYYPYFHGNDIHIEYEGKLPSKNSTYALSRDSGVNCVGKGPTPQQPVVTGRQETCKAPVVVGRRAMRDAATASSSGPQYPSPCRSSETCKNDRDHARQNNDETEMENVPSTSARLSNSDSIDRTDCDVAGRSNESEIDAEFVGNDANSDRSFVVESEGESSAKSFTGKLLTCSEKYPSLGTVIEVQPPDDEDDGAVFEGSPDQPAEYSGDSCANSCALEFDGRGMLPECDMLDVDNYVTNRNNRVVAAAAGGATGGGKLNMIRYSPCMCSHCRQFTYDSMRGAARRVYESHMFEQTQYTSSCPVHGHFVRSYSAPVSHHYCQHYIETDLDRDSCHMVPTGVPPPCYSPPNYNYIPPDEQKLSFLGDYKVVGVV
ncbi:uncharacterized protein LOC141903444 [Tubulanus polymorphus]|uniref:uncharacterized protein LOC141903444 n=1 Tax=Tubulanus polymorphus TaxID=672921 RepID=UPI003DA5DD5C